MNHNHQGLAFFGQGTMYSTRIADCTLDPDSETTKEEPRAKVTDVFTRPVSAWRESTLGKLAWREFSVYERRGKQFMAEHQLAFFILSNVKRVSNDTPCLVGTACNRKAIRVDGIEYRQMDGKLYSKPVSAMEALEVAA